MIELTEKQAKALTNQADAPWRVVNPLTQEAFVLLKVEDYEQLKSYDDSPWTDDEMDMLAAEDADSLGWEGMDAYQDDSP